MRIHISIALVLAAVACHKAPQVEPRPQEVFVGDFAYRINIGASRVEGLLSIAGTTVLLEAEGEACRQVSTAMPNIENRSPFRCIASGNSFGVSVDPVRPELSAWSVTKQVWKTHEVCVRYMTSKDGQRVCTSSRTERYLADSTYGGRLHVTRIAAIARP